MGSKSLPSVTSQGVKSFKTSSFKHLLMVLFQVIYWGIVSNNLKGLKEYFFCRDYIYFDLIAYSCVTCERAPEDHWEKKKKKSVSFPCDVLTGLRQGISG